MSEQVEAIFSRGQRSPGFTSGAGVVRDAGTRLSFQHSGMPPHGRPQWGGGCVVHCGRFPLSARQSKLIHVEVPAQIGYASFGGTFDEADCTYDGKRTHKSRSLLSGK